MDDYIIVSFVAKIHPINLMPLQSNFSKIRGSQWKFLPFVPIIGLVAYVLLFVVAAGKYGGSQDVYTWTEHLFCDLMKQFSSSGFENGARTIAIIGNSFLFIGMAVFFYILPSKFNSYNWRLKTVQILGVTSMSIFLFLFSVHHDTVVLISGILGTVLVYLLIKEYYFQFTIQKSGFAIFCLMLSIVFFLLYQFRLWEDYLPIVQRTAFVLDSSWVALTCLSIAKDIRV